MRRLIDPSIRFPSFALAADVGPIVFGAMQLQPIRVDTVSEFKLMVVEVQTEASGPSAEEETELRR